LSLLVEENSEFGPGFGFISPVIISNISSINITLDLELHAISKDTD